MTKGMSQKPCTLEMSLVNELDAANARTRDALALVLVKERELAAMKAKLERFAYVIRPDARTIVDLVGNIKSDRAAVGYEERLEHILECAWAICAVVDKRVAVRPRRF